MNIFFTLPYIKGVFFLLFICSFIAPISYASDKNTLKAVELVKRLQAGGHILYVRHAATDHSQQDKDLRDLSNCSLQRNLSQQGKDESRVLGESLKTLNIKIGGVYTSPYCRCVDTAKIAFGRYEIVHDMRASFATDLKESTHLVSVLKDQLSKAPKQGLNTVLVGHTANLRELTRVWPKPEGVAHIFSPMGKGKYKHLGHITPKQWAPLAEIK